VNTWLRNHPWQADGLLAAALLAVSVSQIAAGQAGAASRAAFVVVTVLLAATVLARRRYPVAAFAVAAVIGAAQIAFGVQTGGSAPVFALQPTNADVAILVLLYTLAAYRPRPVSISGLVICLLGSAVAIARWSPAHGAHPAGALFAAAAGLGSAVLAPWLMARVAPRWLVSGSIVIEAAGLVPLIWLTPASRYLPLILAATLVEGLGTGIAGPTTLNLALRGVLPSDTGAAGAATSA